MAVLELLADYLDETVSANDRARIERHLAGCDWCEQFGGDYGETVKALRLLMHGQERATSEVSRVTRRLSAVLDAE